MIEEVKKTARTITKKPIEKKLLDDSESEEDDFIGPPIPIGNEFK